MLRSNMENFLIKYAAVKPDKHPPALRASPGAMALRAIISTALREKKGMCDGMLYQPRR